MSSSLMFQWRTDYQMPGKMFQSFKNHKGVELANMQFLLQPSIVEAFVGSTEDDKQCSPKCFL